MWLWMVGLAVAGDDPFALEPRVEQLDNGLVVILAEDHRTDMVALHVAFGVGSRDERDGERGCAHLFEHLMFEGSEHVPANGFDQWLTEAGGDNNAYTSEDVTAYHMTFPSGALDLALFLESDRLGFLDSGLFEGSLENQQDVVLQERAEGYAEPGGRDWDAMSRLLWPEDHPYHHPVIGTVADIEGFSLDAVRGFWERHYRPSNATLALVGNFDTEEALERLRFWFSDVPPRGDAVERATDPRPGGVRGKQGVVFDDVEERTVYLVWETVPERHADEAALDLLAQLMSGGRGTRLDDKLYYESDRTSSIGMWSVTSELAGQMVVHASSPDTPLPKIRKWVDKELARVAKTPPTPEELDRARRSFRGWLLDALESPERKAEILADCHRQTGEADCLAVDWARYEAVTPADLQRVAAKYLTAEPAGSISNVPRGDDGFLEGAVEVELP